MTELKAQLEGLEKRLIGMDWKATVPDDVQSEVRMLFNEALAGGPNTNGDGGPLLTPHHALDCVWAAQRIEALTRALSPSPDPLEEALFAIADGEGDAQEIARQTLEANGRGVPCVDEGCPQHGTRHICFNRTALATNGGRAMSAPMSQDEVEAMVKLLTRRCSNGHSGTKAINPDGPAAAALLTRLSAQLKDATTALEGMVSWARSGDIDGSVALLRAEAVLADQPSSAPQPSE